MATHFDYLLKIVIIGDQGVGKSSILVRYADNTFTSQSIATIGVDFKIKTLLVDGKTVKLQIWDTAGQEKFRNITTSYYRGAHGIILVCDVTNDDTFKNLPGWLEEVSSHVNEKEVKRLLIGNKVDLEDKREVSHEALKTYSEEVGIPFIETSAKDAINIEKVFETMATEIISAHMKIGLTKGSSKKPGLDLDSTTSTSEGGGCCG